MQNTLKTMTAEADALKAQGRLNDAIAVHHRIVAAFPENAIAAHNLAATLGDAGFHGESAEQARNALRLGSKAAETHLVLARALMNNAELDAALEVYDTTCSINPQMVNAQYERCQLIWMMTNDRSAALDPLEREIKSAPGAKGLLFVRARVLQYTGDMDRACDQMEALVAGAPRDVGLLCQAAHLLNLGGRTDRPGRRKRRPEPGPGLFPRPGRMGKCLPCRRGSGQRAGRCLPASVDGPRKPASDQSAGDGLADEGG